MADHYTHPYLIASPASWSAVGMNTTSDPNLFSARVKPDHIASLGAAFKDLAQAVVDLDGLLRG